MSSPKNKCDNSIPVTGASGWSVVLVTRSNGKTSDVYYCFKDATGRKTPFRSIPEVLDAGHSKKVEEALKQARAKIRESMSPRTSPKSPRRARSKSPARKSSPAEPRRESAKGASRCSQPRVLSPDKLRKAVVFLGFLRSRLGSLTIQEIQKDGRGIARELKDEIASEKDPQEKRELMDRLEVHNQLLCDVLHTYDRKPENFAHILSDE